MQRLTVHGDLIRLQFQDLLLEELLLNITLQVMLSFGEPLKTHLNMCQHITLKSYYNSVPMQCILRDRTLGNKEQLLSALHLVYIFIYRKHIVLVNVYCVILCQP